MTEEQARIVMLEQHVATLFAAIGALSTNLESLSQVVEWRETLLRIDCPATAH